MDTSNGKDEEDKQAGKTSDIDKGSKSITYAPAPSYVALTASH